MIRVVLVDNDRKFLQPFQQFLSFQPDIEIVGTANNGEEALDVVEMTHLDVVVMDIRMPVLDWTALARRGVCAPCTRPAKCCCSQPGAMTNMCGKASARALGFNIKMPVHTRWQRRSTRWPVVNSS